MIARPVRRLFEDTAEQRCGNESFGIGKNLAIGSRGFEDLVDVAVRRCNRRKQAAGGGYGNHRLHRVSRLSVFPNVMALDMSTECREMSRQRGIARLKTRHELPNQTVVVAGRWQSC